MECLLRFLARRPAVFQQLDLFYTLPFGLPPQKEQQNSHLRFPKFPRSPYQKRGSFKTYRNLCLYPDGCGSKNRYQNGTLVIGNMGQNLRNPSCLILSHTQVSKPTKKNSTGGCSWLPGLRKGPETEFHSRSCLRGSTNNPHRSL